MDYIYDYMYLTWQEIKNFTEKEMSPMMQDKKKTNINDIIVQLYIILTLLSETCHLSENIDASKEKVTQASSLDFYLFYNWF